MVIFGFVTKEVKKSIKLNQIQIIGSHNSYKQQIEPSLMEMVLAHDSNALGLDYYHLPIAKQLDLGIRSLEIDVLHDPIGGRYNEPMGLKLQKSSGQTPQPYNADSILSKPGLKVLHVPDIDFRSHHLTFQSCLSEIKKWSKKNEGHIPIIITINPKTNGIDLPGFTKVLPFNLNVLDSLDREIYSVFERSELVSPKMVKGDFNSLKEAVTKKGWPELRKVRNKVMFVLDADETLSEMYVQDESYYQKPMFSSVNKTNKAAAFIIMNDPIRQEMAIQQCIKEGFMVRTRADANTMEARNGDYSRFKAAVNSGANVISTDYYVKELSPNGDFEIQFDNEKYQRCNPIFQMKNCDL